MNILHPASFAKAERLGARSSNSVELWNWLHERSKRELSEILLAHLSDNQIRRTYTDLEHKGLI